MCATRAYRHNSIWWMGRVAVDAHCSMFTHLCCCSWWCCSSTATALQPTCAQVKSIIIMEWGSFGPSNTQLFILRMQIFAVRFFVRALLKVAAQSDWQMCRVDDGKSPRSPATATTMEESKTNERTDGRRLLSDRCWADTTNEDMRSNFWRFVCRSVGTYSSLFIHFMLLRQSFPNRGRNYSFFWSRLSTFAEPLTFGFVLCFDASKSTIHLTRCQMTEWNDVNCAIEMIWCD